MIQPRLIHAALLICALTAPSCVGVPQDPGTPAELAAGRERRQKLEAMDILVDDNPVALRELRQRAPVLREARGDIALSAFLVDSDPATLRASSGDRAPASARTTYFPPGMIVDPDPVRSRGY